MNWLRRKIYIPRSVEAWVLIGCLLGLAWIAADVYKRF